MKSEIKTPRGTFKIEREFKNSEEAKENGYYPYFTNDDGTEIYTYHIDRYHCKFGIISKLKKFYYTFGSSTDFPYQGGWVEVKATTLKVAHEIFRFYYPDRVEGILNCADYYTEEQFIETEMLITGNIGLFCNKTI